MRYTIEDLKYGGKYHSSFWDANRNFFVSITNCLANCTCEVVGDCLVTGDPVPVSKPCNANNFHNNLANGWYAIPFNIKNVRVGDILEWTDGCHVARVAEIVDGKIMLNCSWYTGVHGVAIYNGSWDNRPFNSLQQVSDFMIENYPTRFYHCWELERENAGVGYSPRYILVKPNKIEADTEDKNVDQILVKTNEQNVRDNPNGNIVGTASSGYYNVYGSVDDGKYVWYQIKDKLYIAGVEGRVEYIEGDGDIERLKRENAELKYDMAEIYDIVKRWL